MDARPSTPRVVASPGGEAGALCVHFAADARDHAMWFLDGDDFFPALSGFTAGLRADWHVSPAGIRRAAVVRGGGDVLCEAILLTGADTGAGDDPAALASEAYRRERELLRNEGVPSHPAALLSSIRQRPLLATFARRVELPPPLARHVHGLLLRTAADHALSCTCCGQDDSAGPRAAGAN